MVFGNGRGREWIESVLVGSGSVKGWVALAGFDVP
jgi:hypothetical protein